MAFNNTYNPPEIPTPENITLDVLVDKTVRCSGDSKIGPEGFLFLLENLDNDALNQVLKTDAEGNALHQLTFTAEDLGKTFHYRLTEVNDNKEGVTYSTAEYLIDITISLDEQNNLLKADITINGEASGNIVATFVNEYEKPDVSAPTGDTAEPILLIGLMILSAAGILIILLGGRKQKKNEEDT